MTLGYNIYTNKFCNNRKFNLFIYSHSRILIANKKCPQKKAKQVYECRIEQQKNYF